MTEDSCSHPYWHHEYECTSGLSLTLWIDSKRTCSNCGKTEMGKLNSMNSYFIKEVKKDG